MAKKTGDNAYASLSGLVDANGFMGLTWPAVVALVGYIILCIVVLVPFDMYVYDQQNNKYVKTPYSFGNRILIVVLLFFPFFLGVYSVNCMMVGDCRIWSWIVAIATLLWACIVIITAINLRSFRLEDVSHYKDRKLGQTESSTSASSAL
jgi:fumarate reductase subunit D